MPDWRDPSYDKACTCGGVRVNGRCSSCGSTTGYSADRERGQPKEPNDRGSSDGGCLWLVVLAGTVGAAFESMSGWIYLT